MLRVLPRSWVYDVMHLAETREAYRLFFVMWRDAGDDAERAEIVGDLQELLDDRDKNPRSEPIESRDDFDRVYGSRRALKAHLRKLIEERGGVSEVARRAEMPQPSLSRLLNSLAEPRSATMARLAQAMGVTVSRLYPSSDEAPAELIQMPTTYRVRQLAVASIGRSR